MRMRFNPSSRGRSLKVTEIFSFNRVSSPLNQTPDCFSMSLATCKREVSTRFTESKPSFRLTASPQKATWYTKKPTKDKATRPVQKTVLTSFRIMLSPVNQESYFASYRLLCEGNSDMNLIKR
jgi:hypothetical protein